MIPFPKTVTCQSHLAQL